MKTIRWLFLTTLQTPPLLIIMVVVLASLIFSAVMYSNAPHKISPQLNQQLISNESLDIVVYLNFLPEDFHIRHFQKIGNVVAVEENTITVLSVSSEDIKVTARKYWVNQVKLTTESNDG